MSELKAFDLKVGKNLETDSPLVVGVDNKLNSRIMSGEEVYLKSDVDAAIAELKQKLEDAGMEQRRIHKAFYKACANWANIRVAFSSSYSTKERWRKMEHKCRAKAEEYK